MRMAPDDRHPVPEQFACQQPVPDAGALSLDASITVRGPCYVDNNPYVIEQVISDYWALCSQWQIANSTLYGLLSVSTGGEPNRVRRASVEEQGE